MEIIIIVLISIDFLLLFIGKIIFYLRAYKIVSIKDFFKRINEATPEKKNEDKEKVKWKDRTLLKKVYTVLVFPVKLILGLSIALLLVVFGVGIGIGIPTAGIWGTIWIGSSIGMVWAVVFLLLINILYFLGGYGMLRVSNVDNESVKRVLIMDVIKFSMLILTLYYVGFDYNLGIQNLITTLFRWDMVINNLASIFMPMFFYAVLITNIFALGVRFKNILTKKREKHSIIRFHQVLLIFISACYLGIILITDIDFNFMTELERTLYFETLEVVKWVVTSVFIPLFLYSLNEYRKPKKDDVHRPRRRTSGYR